jgi:hypothetical protein
MADLPRWQEPPLAVQLKDRFGDDNAHVNRTRELDELTAILKEHPGDWALVGYRSSAGGGNQYRRRGLEVTTRKLRDGRYELYTRWPA